jgi:hypothetical protein
MGLFTAALCGLLMADAPRDGDAKKAAKARDRGNPSASRPAMTDDDLADDPAIRPPGWRRDWWPRRDGRGRYGVLGPDDRLRLKQGPGGPPWADDDSEQMSPEQVSQLMEFARQNFPKLHKRLLAVRDTNPAVFHQMVKRVKGPISEITRLQERDPEAARKLIEAHRIEIDLTELRTEYQAAKSDSQREQAKSKMRELVAKRCELRLQRLKDEVSDLEKRLEQAKKEMTKREKDKDQVVDQELKRLLNAGPVRPGADLLPPLGGSGAGPKPGKRGQGLPPPAVDTPAPIQ